MQIYYKIYHYSNDFCFSPFVKRFDTLSEAREYVATYTGGKSHVKDFFEIAQVVATGKAVLDPATGKVNLKEDV